MPPSLAWFCRCAAAPAVLLIAAAAIADVDLIQEDLQGTAPNGGVYVHDSAVALDRMALAQRLENLQEWNKSAEIYQEIVEKYRDRVVPSAVDENGVIDQYKSVLARVNQHLCQWPRQGLSVYRSLYELTARHLLDSARGDDLGPVHETFTRYFATDSGKLAGLKLVDAYFELGDFPAAAWIGQALLLHPDLIAERPGVLFRVGLAAHLSGDETTAQKMLAELKDKFAASVGTVAGRDVVLANELNSDLSSLKTDRTLVSTQLPEDSWPMFGGDASRGRASFATARPGAKLYAIALPQANWKAVPDPGQRKVLQQQDQDYRSAGAALGVMPVADRGELFFQDNAHVYALGLQNGLPLPGWLATYPAANGQFSLPKAWNVPLVQQFSVTVTDTAVLAVMDLPDALASMYPIASDDGGKLVCLDRASGKEIWTVVPRDLPDDSLKTLRLGGSPLAVGSNVYIAARNVKGNGYEDCYVLCFDAASGTFRWACYVAGAPNVGQTMQDRNQQFTSFEVPTHLSYSSGRIYVATEMGAVAALDAYSGAIAWLDLYREPTDAAAVNQFPMGRFGWGGGFGGGPPGGFASQTPWNPSMPWTANAAIVQDGNVFVLPADGKYILIYDAGSGKLVQKLRKSDCCRSITDDDSDAASEPLALLGVLSGVMVQEHGASKWQDLLLLATRNSVCAITWRTYSADNHMDSLVWKTAHEPGETIRGRPFVTADSIYIPTAKLLCRAAIRNGQIVQAYPAEGSWPADEGPGNVLVCGDHVVIAGDKTVAVYTDVNLARAKLEREITAAPADPEARLHYAEVMFLANQASQATAKLDEAIKLLNAAPPQKLGEARDRAFDDALTFAVKSGISAPAEWVAGLFDRAGALSRSPSQAVKYRLARARFLRQLTPPDLAAAMGLYQEILASAALSTAPAEVDKPPTPPADTANGQAADAQNLDPEMSQAAHVAQSDIDALLKEPKGIAAYQPFEHKAQARLAAGIAANDPDGLWAVAVEYPNSSVAQKAEDAAALAFEAHGRPRQATWVLRQIYLRSTDAPARAAVLLAMARNYLKIPGEAATAAGRLARAIRLDPAAQLDPPLILPDGAHVPGATPGEALAAVRKFTDQSAGQVKPLPLLGFPSHAEARAYTAKNHQQLNPLAPNETVVIDDVAALLAIDQDAARYDRLATWTAGRGVSIYPVGAPQPLGTDRDIAEEPRAAAWVNGGKELLVWTRTALALIDGEKVQTRWKLDLSSLADVDVLAQSAPKLTTHLIQQMDPRTMRRMWRGGLVPGLNRPFVAQPLPAGADDEPAPAPTVDESLPAEKTETVTAVNPLTDIVLISTSSGRVAAVNRADGTVRWQLRLVNHAVDCLAANDDFTVIKATDEPDSLNLAPAVRLAVVDTSTGRLLARRLFMTESARYPMNIALSDDGTLAYTMPDQVVLRDLFEVGRDGNVEGPSVATSPLQGRPFQNMTRPGQLLIHDGQVLALCEEGKLLRGYSIETGQARVYSQGGQLLAMDLPTGEGTDQTVLRTSGGYVYAVSPRAVAAYNLEHPDVRWGPQALDQPGAVRQALFGKDYLVLLNAADPAGAAGESSWWMSAFSRAAVANKPGTESGAEVFTPQFTASQGIISWALVDGGMCYLSGDHRLHEWRGNQPPPADAKP